MVGWLHDSMGGFTAALALVAGITLAAVVPASCIRDEHPADPIVAPRATVPSGGQPGAVARAEA